jgi:hypothetical protein
VDENSCGISSISGFVLRLVQVGHIDCARLLAIVSIVMSDFIEVEELTAVERVERLESSRAVAHLRKQRRSAPNKRRRRRAKGREDLPWRNQDVQ